MYNIQRAMNVQPTPPEGSSQPRLPI